MSSSSSLSMSSSSSSVPTTPNPINGRPLPLPISPAISATRLPMQSSNKVTVSLPQRYLTQLQASMEADIQELEKQEKTVSEELAKSTSNCQTQHATWQKAYSAYREAKKACRQAQNEHLSAQEIREQHQVKQRQVTRALQTLREDLRQTQLTAPNPLPLSASSRSSTQAADVVMASAENGDRSLVAPVSLRPNMIPIPPPPSTVPPAHNLDFDTAMTMTALASSSLLVSPSAPKRSASNNQEVTSPSAKRTRADASSSASSSAHQANPSLIAQIFKTFTPVYLHSKEGIVTAYSPETEELIVRFESGSKTLSLKDPAGLFFRPEQGKVYLVKKVKSSAKEKCPRYSDAKIISMLTPTPSSKSQFEIEIEWQSEETTGANLPKTRVLTSWHEILPFSSKDPEAEKFMQKIKPKQGQSYYQLRTEDELPTDPSPTGTDSPAETPGLLLE